MFDDNFQDFDNDDSALAQKESEEQEQWERDNNVASILSNDPGYIAWADELDRQVAEDRNIMDLAAIEDERNFNTSCAWD